MDFLTQKSLTEMQFYLNSCKGNLGICFNQAVPFELLAKSPINSFYYYQKELPSRRDNNKFIQGELDELPFLTDSVDVFIIWHNLDFYESLQKVVKECWRALSPNGVLLIVGANNPCFFSRVEYGKQREQLIKRSWLVRTLLHQGFEVEVEHTLGFHPVSNLSWLNRWFDVIEMLGQFCTPMMGSNFLLQARKNMFGLNAPAVATTKKLRVAPKEVAQPTTRV